MTLYNEIYWNATDLRALRDSTRLQYMKSMSNA